MTDRLVISFPCFDWISALSSKVETILESALRLFEVLRFPWRLSTISQVQIRSHTSAFQVHFKHTSSALEMSSVNPPNISTENLFNPSKKKGFKGEILAQNLQRAGFEVLKCDKHSSRVCNPCARKIRNLGSLYSFVQESLQGKITEFTAATPPKSTSANNRLLDTPEGKSQIRKSVRVLSPATKTNKGKSSRKSLEFVQERLHASEKENNDNIDQYLNIDNLPEGGLQVKVVFKTESENVLVRIPRDEMTKGAFD